MYLLDLVLCEFRDAGLGDGDWCLIASNDNFGLRIVDQVGSDFKNYYLTTKKFLFPQKNYVSSERLYHFGSRSWLLMARGRHIVLYKSWYSAWYEVKRFDSSDPDFIAELVEFTKSKLSFK